MGLGTHLHSNQHEFLIFSKGLVFGVLRYRLRGWCINKKAAFTFLDVSLPSTRQGLVWV